MVRSYAAWPCAHARPVRSGVALQASGPPDPGGPDPHRAGGGCHGPPVQRRCREPWPRYHVQSRQVRARHGERAWAARSRTYPRRPHSTGQVCGGTRARGAGSGGVRRARERKAGVAARDRQAGGDGEDRADTAGASVPHGDACADAACRRGRPGGGSSSWSQRRCRVPHRTSARNSWARSRRLSTGI